MYIIGIFSSKVSVFYNKIVEDYEIIWWEKLILNRFILKKALESTYKEKQCNFLKTLSYI